MNAVLSIVGSWFVGLFLAVVGLGLLCFALAWLCWFAGLFICLLFCLFVLCSIGGFVWCLVGIRDGCFVVLYRVLMMSSERYLEPYLESRLAPFPNNLLYTQCKTTNDSCLIWSHFSKLTVQYLIRPNKCPTLINLLNLVSNTSKPELLQKQRGDLRWWTNPQQWLLCITSMTSFGPRTQKKERYGDTQLRPLTKTRKRCLVPRFFDPQPHFNNYILKELWRLKGLLGMGKQHHEFWMFPRKLMMKGDP